MRFLIAICSILTFCHTNTLIAAETADATKLVRQLGAKSFRTRQRATKRLVKLGDAALPALKRGLKSPDTEIRDRCRSVIEAINIAPLEERLRTFVDDENGTLPGWKRFKKLAGNSGAARQLFAAIYRVDRPLLETLQKNPSRAKSLITPRSSTLARGLSKMTSRQVLGRSAGILYAAALAPSLDYRAFSRLSSTLRRNGIPEVLAGNQAARKMLEAIVRQQTDKRSFYNRIRLTKEYRLTKFAQQKLGKELMNRLTAELKKNSNAYRIRSLASQATQAGLINLLEQKMKPAILKWATQNADTTEIDDLYALASLSRSLKMPTILSTIVRPAFIKWLERKPLSIPRSRTTRVVRIAQYLNLESTLRRKLIPLLENKMLAASLEPDRSQISRLHSQARSLGLTKSIDAFLKPATEKLLRKSTQKNIDYNELNQLVYLAQRIGVTKALDQTLKPYIREKAPEFCKGNDFNKAYRIYQLAARLAMQKTIDQQIVPAINKTFRRLQDRPIKSTTLYRALSLVSSIGSEDGLNYALHVAFSKGTNNSYRGRAIHTVAKAGGKKHIDQLTKLLDAKQTVSTRTFNGLKLQTQLRDIALAAVVHLSGQSLQKYGFDYAVKYRRELPSISYSYLGFSSDKKRQQARQKWESFRSKQQKKAG